LGGKQIKALLRPVMDKNRRKTLNNLKTQWATNTRPLYTITLLAKFVCQTERRTAFIWLVSYPVNI